MVPTNGKREIWKKAFYSQGILIRLEKSGNFSKKYWKNKKKLCWKIGNNTENVRHVMAYLNEKLSFEKYWEKSIKFVSLRKWDHVFDCNSKYRQWQTYFYQQDK